MKKLKWKLLTIAILFSAGEKVYCHSVMNQGLFRNIEMVQRQPVTVITAPLDGRPISIEYLENLVEMGGDKFIPVKKEFLDKGFNKPTNGEWVFGDSPALRKSILEQVKKNDQEETTVIINTSSYITRGLVGCRIPDNYNKMNIAKALDDLDYLTSNYTKPRYYIHVMIPRTIPENRGFNYRPNQRVHGLRYFYDFVRNKVESDVKDESFDEVLVEFGYVRYKQQKGIGLTDWEKEFLSYFDRNYILNAPEAFKENGVPLPLLYLKIFQQSTSLIKALADRLHKGMIDELVISVEDYNLPNFIYSRKSENWVVKDSFGNPVKYSFGLECLDEIMEYLQQLFGEKELKSSTEGRNSRFNFIYGTDEIPQMIYARDLTGRSGIATRFNVDYSHDVNPERSKAYVGFFDVATTEEVIDQRINFVTRKTEDGFEKGVSQKQEARIFDLFVHNSDIPELSTFTKEQADAFAGAVYASFNKDNNVGVLDLQTNSVDWELFKALSESPGNSIAQLGCYSGWNTIGNSTGLGIAHAQVFGIIDYEAGNNKKVAECLKWHGKILAQHLLEDALYNRKIKGEKPGDFEFVDKNIFRILGLNQEYDQYDKPGGAYWVLNHFTNSKMRIGNRFYQWGNASLKTATLPFNRTFECLVDVEFKNIEFVK